MLLRRKPPAGKPAFRAKLLEDPAALAENGRAEEIHAYVRAREGAPMEGAMQAQLAERFYSDVHNRAVLRLLAPLAIPCAASLLVRPLLENAFSQFQIVAGFVAGIFASALYGRRKYAQFSRSLSALAGPMLGQLDSPLAQERMCHVISEGEDAQTAFTLLSGGKLSSIAAQSALAEVIYKHGTREQAQAIVESESVPESAKGMLRLKCES
ncbi:MAG TPA: hypothetical protein VLD37_06790 [Candidatus Bilamarchaeum sp.]|nr:hypothetical protein [Candidatus Bilamarchaeum sp.]